VTKIILLALLMFFVGCDSGGNVAQKLADECPGTVTIIFGQTTFNKHISVECQYENDLDENQQIEKQNE